MRIRRSGRTIRLNRPGLSFGYFFRGGGNLSSVDKEILACTVEGYKEQAFISMNRQQEKIRRRRQMSGNVWMFSDEIDDEDLEFMSHDYVTYNMACEYYRLGMKPVIRMAHEAGAVYKIGKKVLIRRSIFEAYLREQRKI